MLQNFKVSTSPRREEEGKGKTRQNLATSYNQLLLSMEEVFFVV